MGKLFIISGPSGSGKTSLSNAIVEQFGQTMNIKKVVTCTSRPPRSGEVDGVDYHFMSPDDFATKIEQGFFIETTQYDDNWYGSPASILDELPQGQSYIMATDLPGTKVINDVYPAAVFIWLSIPDVEMLRERLNKRTGQTQQALEKRIELAKKELEQVKKEDHFNYEVVNVNFFTARDELSEIITKELASSS